MWSFRTVSLLAVLLLLGACGFRPLHGERTPGEGALAEFARIKVTPIADRIGQQLHNYLLTALNPAGRPARPRYVMTTRVKESSQSLAVRKSAFATRANLTVRADYNLVDAVNGQQLTSGQSSITVSYNILDSDFATLMVEKDARSRAVRELSEDIRVRLGVFFAGRRGKEK